MKHARIYAVIAIVLLVLAVSLGGGSPVGAQEPEVEPTPCIKLLRPQLLIEEEQIISQLAEQTLHNYSEERFSQQQYNIITIWGEEDWAVIEYFPVVLESRGVDGSLMMARRVDATWYIALPGDKNYKNWLDALPETTLTPELKELWRNLNVRQPQADSDGIYRLPYSDGVSVYVTQSSDVHGGPIDFWSSNATIVAVADGTVEDFDDSHSACCNHTICAACNNWIRIKHDNGETSDYLHIATGSVKVTKGQRVIAGTPIAIQSDVGYSWGSGRYPVACNGQLPNNIDHCGIHLHFQITDALGNIRKPRICDSQGGWYYPTHHGWHTAIACSNTQGDTSPPEVSFPSPPTKNRWYNTDQDIEWEISDAESGIARYEWWWDNDPRQSVDVSGTPTAQGGIKKLTGAGQGKHTLHFKAWNGAGLPAEGSTGWFGYDTDSPNAPTINPGAGCSNINNQWQNTCRDPNFTWSAADQNGSDGSGIAEYAYTWGTTSSADPSNWSDTTSYDPGPVADADSWGKHYLHVKARDAVGNKSSLSTFSLRYDSTLPTLSLTINNGASTTNQTTVRLNLSANDTGSGVSKMRFSDNDIAWTEWQSYADEIAWTLPALDRRAHTVYAQVRDHAGNESAVADDSITLDMYPPMPHSANYRICQDVINIGGSAAATSTGYSLASSIGQPWGTGADANTGDNFTERAGFLANTTGCLPITYTTTSLYTVTQSVIASGGNLRGSASYRLGDTTGQTAASKGSAFSSTSYILASGFWASITGTVPPTTTIPTPPPAITPTATPTPGPTPTPQPPGFGVSINDGALYTNNSMVTVSVWAPNVSDMRLSNDGGYNDDGWRTYRVTATHVISTYGNYVLPRTVYVWFRDADSAAYGAYFDDIIYDPVSPSGNITLLGASPPPPTATLILDAWDDNSGVSEMRVSDTPTMTLATWQSFTQTIQLSNTGGIFYAQYRDRAGNLSEVYGTDGSSSGMTEKIYLPIVLK